MSPTRRPQDVVFLETPLNQFLSKLLTQNSIPSVYIYKSADQNHQERCSRDADKGESRMLAHPKRAKYFWLASVSLCSLRCVVTRMGYNQTRVCRHMACPSGASDSVPSAHMDLPYPIHHTNCYRLPVCNNLQHTLPDPRAGNPHHYCRIIVFVLCKGFPAVWSENFRVVCLMTSVSFG